MVQGVEPIGDLKLEDVFMIQGFESVKINELLGKPKPYPIRTSLSMEMSFPD